MPRPANHTFPQTGIVNVIHDFHQLVTVAPGLSIIEEVQLRNPGRSEIVEYATRFCISITIHPYPVQNSDGSGNDVIVRDAVAKWRKSWSQPVTTVARLPSVSRVSCWLMP